MTCFSEKVGCEIRAGLSGQFSQLLPIRGALPRKKLTISIDNSPLSVQTVGGVSQPPRIHCVSIPMSGGFDGARGALIRLDQEIKIQPDRADTVLIHPRQASPSVAIINRR